MEVNPIKTGLINAKDDIVKIISECVERYGVLDGDIFVIASKVVAVSEGRVAELAKVRASTKAKRLAKKYALEEGFAQLVIEEADAIFGGVPRAILTLKSGIFVANAGIDHSNAPIGHAILWPKNPQEAAVNIRKRLSSRFGKKLGVIICDSHCVPLRAGSVGVAIGVSGIPAVIDERGKEDIFGRKMLITRRAIADNLSCAAVSVMGECAECTPAALVRNANIPICDDNTADELDKKNISSMYISPKDCLYSSIFSKKIHKIK